MNIETKESYIKIKTIVMKDYDGDYYVGQILEPEGLKGCITQAKTEEELEKRLLASLKAMISFYESESTNLAKVAIFRGNKTENQIWFTIIGIGLMITRSKPDSVFSPKVLKGWKYFGITNTKAMRLGNLLIFFHNCWKKLMQKHNERRKYHINKFMYSINCSYNIYCNYGYQKH